MRQWVGRVIRSSPPTALTLAVADDSSLIEWRYIVSAASDPTVASHAGADRLCGRNRRFVYDVSITNNCSSNLTPTFKNQKTNMPIAAPNISKVTSTIRIKDNFEGVCFRMICLSKLTSKTPINKNGANKPLMMAVQ